MRLNLGCGTAPRKGWVNLDLRALPGVDVVRDVLRGLPFSDDSVDEIVSENFLEHLPQGEGIWVMNEMHRVLRDGAIATHLVPEAGSVNQFQDPTHLSFWHAETFTYFEWSHGRNRVYGDLIKPWTVTVERQSANDLLLVTMRKVVP